MQIFSNIKKLKIILAILISLLPVLAYAMSSETYMINADTVNSGGNLSSSGSYKLGDSMGEAAIGVGVSGSYKEKTAFWYMLPGGTQLGLNCVSSNVYMADYTLGDANNYSKYIFSTSQKCTITDNTSAPWTLTMQSTNMTSAKNNLSNSNVYLSTDNNVSSGDTITSPTTGISESDLNSSYPANPLNAPQTIDIGDGTASGTYDVRPTMKLTNLNTFYSEAISGTITFTIQ
jgi:hypothetical protein